MLPRHHQAMFPVVRAVPDGAGSSAADHHRFGSEALQVAVTADGAELLSLRRTADGREMLWQAGPAWPRRAPVLFPIVGRLPKDTLRVDGRTFPMTQHGFARDRRFRFTHRDETGCTLELRDDEDTRKHFPFPFRLEITYLAENNGVRVEYALHNPGDAVLPASLGAHPAFSWPLAPGTAPDAHRLVFERDEPDPIRRVRGGLLRPDGERTPVHDRVLDLDPALFDDDAVILDRVRSGSVRFEVPGGAEWLRVSWHGMTQLGIWTKPGGPAAGAGFLCIEPWAGLSTPENFEGEFRNKPHLLHVAPGNSVRLGWAVELSAPGA
ncbi:aldose 1-epimerase family protein [Rhizosaccharibacter radicis]|uniref:Aldose 1-epimerase family protein n=1 Tax=Rhizosaccharibacter radicis TaxID=2782605 RepID=A0ABT1VZ38_9PROT|nr:aldose 1-epimerase family protein [Acetobacteraceae bacterium KSS12]